MSYADVNSIKKVQQKTFLMATPTWHYIFHQQIEHSAIPLLMLTCTIITAIGNKTGNTKPMMEVNYTRLYDFYCPVKWEKQNSFATLITPQLVLNQMIINNEF